MKPRMHSLLLAAALLALSIRTGMTQNAAILCSYDGRCLGNFTTSCTCTATGDAAYCGSVCRSAWGSSDAVECLQLSGNDTATQALLNLTDTCNTRAVGANATELSGSYQSEVETDLGCLSDVAYNSSAAELCLAGASTTSCPAFCGSLLGSIPSTCRASIEGNALYGGQFSMLFSACNVSSEAAAAATSGAADSAAAGATPTPPSPDGRLTMQTQAAAPEAAPPLGLWLQVLLGALLLCLGATW